MAGLAIITSLQLRRRRIRNPTRSGIGLENPEQPPLHWILSDAGIGFLTAAVALVGACAMAVMLTVAKNASAGSEQAKLQIEAIKYGLGVIASGGALAALLLALRRQRLAERSHELAIRAQELATRAHEHTESDAAERRVTELYSKAVEQLGSDKAAVRLGGLYSLERVAQNNPVHRQSIVDVICAYLRMPSAVAAKMNSSKVITAQTKSAAEELLVRKAAQEMLARHFKTLNFDTGEPLPSPEYWGRLKINLSGASLHSFDFWHCHVEEAIFTGAEFHGYVQFHGCTFDRRAFFSDAKVYGEAYIVACDFKGVAWFDDTKFYGDTYFEGSTFDAYVTLENCLLSKSVDFSDVTFSEPPKAAGIKFNGEMKDLPPELRRYVKLAGEDH